MTIHTCLHIDANANAINVFTYDDEIGPLPSFLTANGEQVILDYNGPFAPGYHFNGAIIEIPPEAAPQPAVVMRVTAAQAKLALYNAGLLDQVAAAVAGYPPMKIFFDNSPYWDIGHPYVRGLASELGMSDEQVATLFTSAAGL